MLDTPAARQRRKWNLLAALGAGLSIATVCSLYLVVWTLLRPGRLAAVYHLSFLRALLLYYALGLVGGGLVAVLRPLASTRIGAACVGAFIGMVILTAMAVSMMADVEWDFLAWCAAFGVFGGAYSGLLARRMWGAT